ncbi:DUF4249 domain-containing protein [Draconibacterium sediminis]|uniref:DUF4249 domain-containing protein n=1 Tax=Draconibacterium sediminis TaxID=1544798 RepID=A0A0D8J7M8_9BACT|nr:DUF4249 domain-containing protein [Draconibacterium sediminis]KJF42985.1 hypothetical protein LH29_16475 [Draconibacterium sediminis]
MKFTQIIPTLFSVLFLFLASCEKEIEFKGDEIKPILVVNGLVVSGDTVTVKLLQSRSKLEDSFANVVVANAKVDLYVDDEFAETLKPVKEMVYGSETPVMIGKYTSSVIGEAGKSYRLEIVADGFSPVSCETTVPEAIEISAWDTTTALNTNGYGYSGRTEFSIEFDDNGQQHNYYRLQSKSIEGQELLRYMPDGMIIHSDTILIRQQYEWVEILNPQLNEAINEADELITGTPTNQYAIFNDDSFNGKKMKLRFELGYSSYSYGYSNYDNNASFKIRDICLYSISEEYYEYLNTANLHFWLDDDFFSEPVQVFSNIKGGVGIWASASCSSFSLQEGNYPMDDKVYIEADYGYGYGY